MRGLPDYGINTYIQATNMVDMSQLYQGITGIVSVDGLGRIVWSDNFAKGLYKMIESLYGDAESSILFTRITHSSGYALKMLLGTLSGGGGIARNVTKIVPTDSNVGIEASIYVDVAFPTLFMITADYCYSPGNSYLGVLTYDTNNGDIMIYTPTGYIVIDNIPIISQIRLWTPLKLVINTKEGKYERAIIGNVGYDLKQYECHASAQSVISACDFTIRGYARTDVIGQSGYYGEVIITTDEP